MFEHYLAALLSLGQARGLGDRGDRWTGWQQQCSCLQWGIAHGHRPGCDALVKELFPQLDRELDAWEAEQGWLYR